MPSKNAVPIPIVIPTRNEIRNLPRLLVSILHSRSLPNEVIVVDRNSTDGTINLAKKIWGDCHTPLRILKQEGERSSQRNSGAQAARSNYLLFLDADMEIKPRLLEELKNLGKKGAKVAVIPERAIGHDFWGKAIALERRCYRGQALLEAPRFFEKLLLGTLGNFDTTLVAGEDWDLDNRIRQKRVTVARTASALIHHEAN